MGFSDNPAEDAEEGMAMLFSPDHIMSRTELQDLGGLRHVRDEDPE